MTIELIGVVTFLVGITCIFAGRTFATYAFVLSTLLGAASASILTSLGSANLPPAHLLLGFLVVRSCLDDRSLAEGLEALKFPQPGFWLLLTTLYAVLAAAFMPRLFQAATYVFTIARTEGGPGIVLTPLSPVSGNITQTVYFVGDLVCFLLFYGFAGERKGAAAIARAVLACGILNVGFAALDYATFVTGTAELMSFVRNAPYRMLNEAEVMGVKRLVGSFPEASAFGSATLPLFAFSLSLWLNGLYARVAGLVALLSFAALVLSTSSSAYVALAAYLVIAFAGNGLRVLSGSATRVRFGFLTFTPLLALIAFIALQLHDPSRIFIEDVIQRSIFDKLSTDSGIERSNWNGQALQNFVDTYGLGAGTGSVRASSFPIAVLANIGVLGALTYGLFLFGCFSRARGAQDPEVKVIKTAATSACLALLIAASLGGTTIDLGLMFFVLSAVAAAPERAASTFRVSQIPAGRLAPVGVPP